MNAVTMVALFIPAQDFFSWVNYGTAAVSLASAFLLYFAVPWSSPRLEYDLACEKQAAGGYVGTVQ